MIWTTENPSAKGATHTSLGQRPRERPIENTSAEGATHGPQHELEGARLQPCHNHHKRFRALAPEVRMNKLRYISIFIAALIMLLHSASAQTPSPTTVYKLDTQTQHSSIDSSEYPPPVLSLTPDQALLVLLPQQSGKWLFKRITDWETGAPKEETLTFSVKPLVKKTFLASVTCVMNGGCFVASRFVTLDVDPEQRFAVLRVESDGGVNNNPADWTRSGEIVIVDLRSFTIVAQQDTTDPVLASSNWEFAKNGMLIASAQTERTTSPTKPRIMGTVDTILKRYKAAALTVPSLKSSMECEYTTFTDYRDPKAGDTPKLTTVSAGCASLVALAQVPAADNLPDGRPKYKSYAKLAGQNCFRIEDKSLNLLFSLYRCSIVDEDLDGLITITKTRNLIVLKVPSGQQALNIPLPHNRSAQPALLAQAGGHTWLLLLRDGNKLETYRIP
jgi:hypothetical protein